MSELIAIGVFYRGLEVGRGLSMRFVDSIQAYIGHEQPMPVGTLLEVRLPEQTLGVQVCQVQEACSAERSDVGMLVRLNDTEASALAWWQENAPKAIDVPRRIKRGTGASESQQIQSARVLDAAETQAMEPVTPVPENDVTDDLAGAGITANMSAISEEEVAREKAKSDSSKRKRKRRRRKTQ